MPLPQSEPDVNLQKLPQTTHCRCCGTEAKSRSSTTFHVQVTRLL